MQLTRGYPLTPNDSFSSIKKLQSPLETIRSKITELSATDLSTSIISPFYVCDLNKLDSQLDLWRSTIPEIEPMYAIKCNPTPGFVNALIQRGIGFDCASIGEIESVISKGCSNIIYANTIKSPGQIFRASQLGIGLTTVDSIEEIVKISMVKPGLDVLVRITTDDSTSTCPLSIKFGANVSDAMKIVDECRSRGVNVRGVAFHLGSGFHDLSTMKKAMDDSRSVWDYAEKQGIQFDTLDIGGGFSADESEFLPAGQMLRNEIWRLYGAELEENRVKIIAELGRFLAAPCFKLVTNVNGIRKMDGNKTRVYINDGLYGNLNCILYDHQEVEPIVLTSYGRFVDDNIGTTSTDYSIWGPTCDGLDCVVKSCKLPFDVESGDWMYFENAGAYTSTAATSFNGFTNDFECIFIN